MTLDSKRLDELEQFDRDNSLDLYCDIFFEGDCAELIRLARLGLLVKECSEKYHQCFCGAVRYNHYAPDPKHEGKSE